MEGYPFTWEISKGIVDWVEERLDRALPLTSWIRLFLRAKVHNLEASISNHLPIFLEPTPMVIHSRHRRKLYGSCEGKLVFFC